MAYDVDALIDNYVNLLIIQYHDKPNAQALVRAVIGEVLANAILLQIRDAYDLDTAVGVQLDVLGKYIGTDRYFRELDLINYFGLTDYEEYDPDAMPKFGFTDYADFANYDYNGTLTYDAIIAINTALLDETYRIILRLKIIQNTSNFSWKSIDESIYKFFPGQIRPESNGGMHMVYFISSALSVLIAATLYKQILPKPMGVGLLTVNGVNGLMFGLTDYSGYESPYAYGFADYDNYASLAGQELVYNQITAG